MTIQTETRRQRNSTTLTATYRIVTPMFCSGADQTKAELRLASFKGALRFWWRSMMAGEVGNNIQELQNREAELFGSSNQKYGQSKVRMRLRWCDGPPLPKNWIADWPKNKPPTGSTYLGFGITESGEKGEANYQPHRVGLPQGISFEVHCRLPERHCQTVVSAMALLGLVGGLGNRSRRAFGSLAITKTDDEVYQFKNIEEYRKALSEKLNSTAGELPDFTAFSRYSQLAFLSPQRSAIEAHNALGEAYRAFRGKPSNLRGRTKIPIGLPLQGVDSRRRASPLIMHIHPIGKQFVPVVLFLPSLFHPEIANSNSINYFKVISDWMKELKGISL